eukprot:IDg23108t1
MLEVAYAVASARPARVGRPTLAGWNTGVLQVVPETFQSKQMFQSKVGYLYQNNRTTGLNTRRLLTGMYENIPI